MYCTNCGNEMKEDEQYCTSCGMPRNVKEQPIKTSSGIRTTSLVLGIIACFLSFIPILSIPLAIASIITGIAAKKEDNKLSIGVILGFISIIITIILIACIFFLFALIRTEERQFKNDFQIDDATEDFYHNFMNPEEHIADIKGYSWLADDKSMLYLNADESYIWYQKDEDHKDNYYEGHFKTYKGEEAIKYISSNLKEYGLTEEDQRKIIENKDIDNYYLIIITCEKMIQNGKEESVTNNVAYYYGLYSDETKRIELTNLSSKLKIGLTLKEKTSNIDV